METVLYFNFIMRSMGSFRSDRIGHMECMTGCQDNIPDFREGFLLHLRLNKDLRVEFCMDSLPVLYHR